MSDAVIVALITTAGSIFVAVLTMYSTRAADSDSKTKLKKENEALKKQNVELQDIIDYYRKKESH